MFIVFVVFGYFSTDFGLVWSVLNFDSIHSKKSKLFKRTATRPAHGGGGGGSSTRRTLR